MYTSFKNAQDIPTFKTDTLPQPFFSDNTIFIMEYILQE